MLLSFFFFFILPQSRLFFYYSPFWKNSIALQLLFFWPYTYGRVVAYFVSDPKFYNSSVLLRITRTAVLRKLVQLRITGRKIFFPGRRVEWCRLLNCCKWQVRCRVCDFMALKHDAFIRVLLAEMKTICKSTRLSLEILILIFYLV